MYTLEQRDPLGKALAGSLATHAAIVGVFLLAGVLNLKDHWGSEHASSGAVGVSLVKSIPIPQNEGKPNPLANDTDNVAPQEPSQAKPRIKEKAPEPDGIALRDRLKKQKKNAPPPPTYKPMQYQSNQVYSKSGQAAVNPMFGMSGAGGIDIGPTSVLGNRFGAYVQLMKDRIAQHWSTADVRASAQQKCLISFTIARNGTVSNVKVSAASGNYLLDTSAKRAIIDSNPLPALPAQFPNSEATVELGFQLKQ